MGSSAVGVGAGDVAVWNLGQITDQEAATLPTVTSGTNGFLCSAQRTASGIVARAMRAVQGVGQRLAVRVERAGSTNDRGEG